MSNHSHLNKPHVLLIDDDESFCLAMSKALRRRHFDITIFRHSREAIPYLMDPPQDAVAVLDLKMPDLNGLEILQHTQKRSVPVIMLTGHGAVPDAVKAMQAGAYTFLTKPIDAADLAPVILQAYQQSNQQEIKEFVAISESVKHLKKVIYKIAPTEEPILITGETGTGKELIARALHTHSHRSQAPFIAVNMACLSGELVASELFGHVQGAFTGAYKNKKGLFKEVREGTLFLDEVAELPLEHQAKLLRVIEQREIRAIGSSHIDLFKGRLVAATHKNLQQEVAQGKFREDLFYRLQVLPLHIPPVRERIQDIIPIADTWFKRLTGNSLDVSEQALDVMLHHTWPGNVREIVNLMRRLAIFYPQGEEISHTMVERMLKAYPFMNYGTTSDRLTPVVSHEVYSGEEIKLGDEISLEKVERRHIELLLQAHTNMTQVAKILCINRRTLQRKLKSWGMASDDFT